MSIAGLSLNCSFIPGMAFLLIGLLFLRIARREHRLLRQLNSVGAFTNGVVVARWSLRRSGGLATYTVTYRFDLPQPEGEAIPCLHKQEVSRSNYNALPEGTLVPIRYFPANPEKTARLAGSNTDSTEYNNAMFAGVGCCIVAAFVLIMGFSGEQPAKAAPRNLPDSAISTPATDAPTTVTP